MLTTNSLMELEGRNGSLNEPVFDRKA